MRVISVKEFMSEFNFVSVNNEVAINKNSYPFITFINGDNQAENVYFSKGASDSVKLGDSVNRDLLEQFTITIYANEDGEQRIKLSRMGSSKRMSFDDLWA